MCLCGVEVHLSMGGAEEWDIAIAKEKRRNCFGDHTVDWCNSHVFRVTGAHIHDYDECAIECWLGCSFVLFSIATMSVPLYTLYLYTLYLFP